MPEAVETAAALAEAVVWLLCWLLVCRMSLVKLQSLRHNESNLVAGAGKLFKAITKQGAGSD